MVHGANRSGSRQRIHVRTTSKTVERYKEKDHKKPRCACGRVLAGTARGKEVQIKKLAKTERRPSRPYGGQLCTICTRAVLRSQVLSSE